MAARKKTRRRKAKRKTARKAASAEPSYPEVDALADLMQRHGLSELDYAVSADGATEIHMVKGGVPAAAPLPAAPVGALPAAAAPAPTAPAAGEDLYAFTSPMVGTFYRAPSPEASPFITVGDRIEESGVVCIIEAMKVMNEITSEVSGEVVSIEVENGEAVEFGQTLFLIRRA